MVDFIKMSTKPYLPISNKKALEFNSEWEKFLKYSN